MSSRYHFELEVCRRRLIVEALSACNWNITEAARYLGIHRSVVHVLIERYGLPKRLQHLPKWGPELHNRGPGPAIPRGAIQQCQTR